MMVNPISKIKKAQEKRQAGGVRVFQNLPDMKDLTWNLCHLHTFVASIDVQSFTAWSLESNKKSGARGWEIPISSFALLV
jgi:hypothetical protein